MTGLEVALRPPPVAEKGSKALSKIRSIRKCIHAQRKATKGDYISDGERVTVKQKADIRKQLFLGRALMKV